MLEIVSHVNIFGDGKLVSLFMKNIKIYNLRTLEENYTWTSTRRQKGMRAAISFGPKMRCLWGNLWWWKVKCEYPI